MIKRGVNCAGALHHDIVLVADEQLLAYHRHPTRVIEQRETKPVAGFVDLGAG